jgi:hypothetical protein
LERDLGSDVAREISFAAPRYGREAMSTAILRAMDWFREQSTALTGFERMIHALGTN